MADPVEASERYPARRRRLSVVHALIGVVLGLALAVGVLRLASRSKGPPLPAPSVKLAGGVLREDSGSLDEILVHYVPRLEPLVADAHAAGLAVNVWTVNAPGDLVAMAELGVDVVMTDRLVDALRLVRGTGPNGEAAAG